VSIHVEVVGIMRGEMNQYYPFSTISSYFYILLITIIDQQ
jgi:hypothetical protein